ncbi:MAG: hypothetical protein IKX91_05185, partial [Firmicutes bacterium]|nr:hypothetical protein [Bacillota bacterium]
GYSARLNGGANYTNNKVRQDIYIEGYQNTDVTSLRVTGPIGSAEGSIWIWAVETPHYLNQEQFATIANVSDADMETTIHAFRNARDDAETGASNGYLTGRTGAVATNIYWGSIGGFTVIFKKTDGFGNGLNGATFTLYSAIGCNASDALKNGSEDVTAVSETVGTKNGIVTFDAVSEGIWYMKETGSPAGYYASPYRYVVLVGSGNLTVPGTRVNEWAGVLQNVTDGWISAQTAGYSLEYATGNYAIFRIDDSDRAAQLPDIASYGVMNNSTHLRKVILKKVESNSYDPVPGATFDILSQDRLTVVYGAVSGNAGALWIGTLPYGMYYIHERVVPSGYKAAFTDGNWYRLTVNESGSVTQKLAVHP